ncbi:MAG: hypothetical protein KGM17_05595 [Sphingomonadales bacterium]|nr:hypothetical protein [Sphingomonadales bacterium]
MTPVTWPCPDAAGGLVRELALVTGSGRPRRVLVVPALFEEANKLRRFTVETMRRLDAAGIDAVLPDLPGTNESLQPLATQTPEGWRAAMTAAAAHFGATHVLAIRGGALVAPAALPGWLLAPVKGAGVLRQMLRARILARREAGVEETQDALLAEGRAHGLELAGYRLGAGFIAAIGALEAETTDRMTVTPELLQGPGLWLRAEPGESPAQADALAAIVAVGMAWEAAP